MLPFAYNFPFFCIIGLMLTGVICPMMRNGKIAFYLSLTMAAVTAVLSAVLTGMLFTEGVNFTYVLGHFPAPWGN